MSNKLRIVPLGGLGEIGKNMTVFEYGNEIIIIDAGVMFPESDMLGVDTIIPDYEYLMDKKDRVLAVLITHGHWDHIGALSHLMKEIDVPIYTAPLAARMIRKDLNEKSIGRDVDLIIFKPGDTWKIGSFLIEPFRANHSIPDALGFGITTPVGLLVHMSDYNFDQTPVFGRSPDFAKLAELAGRGVLCLLAESTNADKPGWTNSESVLPPVYDRIFDEATGRIIVATFSTLIARVQLVVDTAIKHGRKVAITGRSMRENTKIARELGYLKIPDDVLLDIRDILKLPPEEIVIIATGTQGEQFAVLGRLARGRNRQFDIEEGDTVVFSSHTIPGNEEPVYRVINMLFQRGADVLYEQIEDVHVSGHASQEEMKLLINLVRPKYLVPIHGELRHLKQHAKLARQVGIAAENIAVVENGTPITVTEDGLEIGQRIPGGYVFVDGASVGEIDWQVMREREKLAQNGFFFVFVPTDGEGKVDGIPQIITRGFVSAKGEESLLEGAIDVVTRMVNKHPGRAHPAEQSLSHYLFTETGRRPWVQIRMT